MPKAKPKKHHARLRGAALADPLERQVKRTGKRGPRPDTPEDAQPAGELINEQGSLPGMEDAAIDDLENVARNYATVRDRRMALTEQEVHAKNLVLSKMKEHGKETYRRDGISIQIVHEAESVKVKVDKDEE
jgi:hypothetical protein